MDPLVSREAVTQNLVDAGCDPPLIDEVWRLLQAGREREGLALLAKHRRRLLDCCHAEQRKLDCLDYLVFQLGQARQRKAGKAQTPR